jgi:DNA-binding PadR family transcriptional regulator
MTSIPFDHFSRRGFGPRPFGRGFDRWSHDRHDRHGAWTRDEHDHGGERPHGRGHGGPHGFGRGGFGGGPGRGRAGRARKGDVRAALLLLLEQGPSNGYGLITGIAERTEGAWRPSPGSVYPTLQQLVDEGLVEQSGDGRGSRYALTDEGRAHVDAHRDEFERAWRAATPEAQDDPFVDGLAKLMPAVHQFVTTATPEQKAQAAPQLDALRKELYRLLAE